MWSSLSAASPATSRMWEQVRLSPLPQLRHTHNYKNVLGVVSKDHRTEFLETVFGWAWPELATLRNDCHSECCMCKYVRHMVCNLCVQCSDRVCYVLHKHVLNIRSVHTHTCIMYVGFRFMCVHICIKWVYTAVYTHVHMIGICLCEHVAHECSMCMWYM